MTDSNEAHAEAELLRSPEPFGFTATDHETGEGQ